MSSFLPSLEITRLGFHTQSPHSVSAEFSEHSDFPVKLLHRLRQTGLSPGIITHILKTFCGVQDAGLRTRWLVSQRHATDQVFLHTNCVMILKNAVELEDYYRKKKNALPNNDRNEQESQVKETKQFFSTKLWARKIFQNYQESDKYLDYATLTGRVYNIKMWGQTVYHIWARCQTHCSVFPALICGTGRANEVAFWE